MYIFELREQLLKYKHYILNKLVIYVIYMHTHTHTHWVEVLSISIDFFLHFFFCLLNTYKQQTKKTKHEQRFLLC